MQVPFLQAASLSLEANARWAVLVQGRGMFPEEKPMHSQGETNPVEGRRNSHMLLGITTGLD